MTDIDELRRLAQAALAGPDGISLNWIKLIQDFQQNAGPATILELLDRLEAAEKAVTEAYQRGYETGQEEIEKERDALRTAVRHEADCVEAAKAEIKALRSELVDLRSSMAFRTSLVGRTEAERDALRAKIEQMERQEPVAFGLYSGWALKATYLKEHEACEQRDRRQLTADLGGSLEAYRVAPLYALPGAKGKEE